MVLPPPPPPLGASTNSIEFPAELTAKNLLAVKEDGVSDNPVKVEEPPPPPPPLNKLPF